MNKILVIGPCYNVNDRSKTGGIVVLFEDYLHYLDEQRVIYKVIDTNKSNYINIAWAYICILFKIIVCIFRFDKISLHGTAKDYLFIAPILVLIGKIFHREVSLRKFAGNFDKIYFSAPYIFQKLYAYVLHNANNIFFETHYLVEFGLQFNMNTFWFPNVRPKVNQMFLEKHKKRQFSNKFIFMSQVKESKGVYDILDAFSHLDNSYSIDFYGPLIDINQTNLNTSNTYYKGALEPKQVLGVLADYDILILPSFHSGEGYPGIVIEALSLGMPCIVSDFGGLSEIIIDGYNGFLVEIKSPKQLCESILRISIDVYPMLSENALKSFEAFESDIIYQKFKSKLC